MLSGLKNLEFPGRKEDIIFFLQSVIGEKSLTLEDVRRVCLHAPGKRQLAVDALVKYCECFGLIKYDYQVSLDKSIKSMGMEAETVNDEIIYRTIDKLFEAGIFTPDLFFYDCSKEKIVFKNEYFPLNFSSVRNVLVSQGFLKVERTQGIRFHVNSRYENIVAVHCKKSKNKLTLEQLKKRLEDNAEAGEKAENFVLEYERKRLHNSNIYTKVRIISNIDVSAGYDIVSFNTMYSLEYDRFIEVKAIAKNKGFYWSSNEFEVAKIKGDKYYLYLVDLSQINDENYEPIIITNPSKEIMSSADWLVEIEKYYIRYI